MDGWGGIIGAVTLVTLDVWLMIVLFYVVEFVTVVSFDVELVALTTVCNNLL